MYNKKCQYEGCGAFARAQSNFCVTHGGGKRCQYEGCGVSARAQSNFCVTHGGGKRCQYEGCGVSARAHSNFCVTHGGGNRCQYEGCGVSARAQSNFCMTHGGGNRCPNCIDWIDSRSGQKQYDGYCATCFKQVFPNDKRSKKIRIKGPETKIRNLLAEHYPQFIHDKVMYTNHCDCTHRRRIDFRYLLHDTMICVEVDERQHKGYNTKDEEDRYHDLYMIYSGKWLFIRFNPDSYFNDKKQRQNPSIESRYHSLLEEIQRQMARVQQGENQELIEVYRLYFDYTTNI
jgi:very-short-patch-repair endonuclease